MQINSVEFVWRQQANVWSCSISFRYTSWRQFTDVHQTVIVTRRWWIAAFFAARWQMKFHVRVHGARPGEREAKGWVK